jgi:hypothetical protein
MPSWNVIKREFELAVHEFIRTRVALNDTRMTEVFARKWDREGGIAGTFGRLVEQAKCAPTADAHLTALDEQVIEGMMRPLFEGRRSDDTS